MIAMRSPHDQAESNTAIEDAEVLQDTGSNRPGKRTMPDVKSRLDLVDYATIIAFLLGTVLAFYSCGK